MKACALAWKCKFSFFCCLNFFLFLLLFGAKSHCKSYGLKFRSFLHQPPETRDNSPAPLPSVCILPSCYPPRFLVSILRNTFAFLISALIEFVFLLKGLSWSGWIEKKTEIRTLMFSPLSCLRTFGPIWREKRKPICFIPLPPVLGTRQMRCTLPVSHIASRLSCSDWPWTSNHPALAYQWLRCLLPHPAQLVCVVVTDKVFSSSSWPRTCFSPHA